MVCWMFLPVVGPASESWILIGKRRPVGRATEDFMAKGTDRGWAIIERFNQDPYTRLAPGVTVT